MNQQKRLSIVFYTQGLSFTGDTHKKQSLGGAETALIYVALELQKMGNKVTVFCFCSQPGVFDSVTYLDSSGFEQWCSTETNCDLFICSRSFDVFAVSIPATYKILWCHDSYTPEQFQHLEQVLPRINEVYCLSDFHRNYFLQHIPNWEYKVHTTHNGVDFEVLNAAVEGIPKKHKIMFTSRPERGLMRALHIYEQIGDKSLEFLICTYEYPWGDVPEVQQMCNAKIHQLNANGFNITTSSFAKEELYQNIAESKAVIYPAEIAEIAPISALEAMACKTVYICADHSGLQEAIPYERLNIEDSNRWVEMLQEVLHNDPYRSDLIQQGWGHVQSYSWTNVAKQLIEIDVIYDANIAYTTNSSLPTGENHNGIYPKISCLMVTSDRVVLPKEAIRSFMNQTYENKELIIIAGGSEHSQCAIEEYVKKLDEERITCQKMGEITPTLGRMRNLSMEAATGEILCQWDDDDLYHPNRIQAQYNAMLEQGASACFLTDHLHYFVDRQELFWVDWTHEGQIYGKSAQLPPSVMMKKDNRFRYPETGSGAIVGEDCAMQEAIVDKVKVVNLSNHGYLYLYRYHKRNTTSEAHHRRISQYATDANFLMQHNNQLLESLRYSKLPLPISVKTKGGQEVMSYYGG